MYFMFFLMTSLFVFLIIKCCMFHIEKSRWPAHAHELVKWKLRPFTRFLLYVLCSFPILIGMTKPFSSLSGVAILLSVCFSIPLILFAVSYFKGDK